MQLWENKTLLNLHRAEGVSEETLNILEPQNHSLRSCSVNFTNYILLPDTFCHMPGEGSNLKEASSSHMYRS